ncbi:hypothetical protein HY639_05345 [Candidatus Woesearchaeota archaeon]|nr:hypothetical protein [Candidatus Woesearchaeota archaeon]
MIELERKIAELEKEEQDICSEILDPLGIKTSIKPEWRAGLAYLAGSLVSFASLSLLPFYCLVQRPMFVMNPSLLLGKPVKNCVGLAFNYSEAYDATKKCVTRRASPQCFDNLFMDFPRGPFYQITSGYRTRVTPLHDFAGYDLLEEEKDIDDQYRGFRHCTGYNCYLPVQQALLQQLHENWQKQLTVRT